MKKSIQQIVRKKYTMKSELIGRQSINKIKTEHIPNKYMEKRPWGDFEQFCLNTPCTVKIINVNPNAALSLQYHNNRSELWRVIDGKGVIIIGEKEYSASKGKEFFIPFKTKHQIITEVSPIQILEISFGHFDEEDIVRLSDKYNRR